VQRHPDYTRTRIAQLTERLEKKIYPQSHRIDELLVAGPVDRISYGEAQKIDGFRPAELGDQFGPLWATFWFRARVNIPKAWVGKRVDLLWESHSEATLWINGRSIQGLNYEPAWPNAALRPDAVLLPKARGGETFEFQLELACNSMFGERHHHPFKQISPFLLDRADIAVFDEQAWTIYYDLYVLQQLLEEGKKDLDKTWGGELMAQLNHFANVFEEEDRATWDAGHAILKKLLERKNATVTHELSAIGHAHIDTAWLWPLAETHRKCERTFSSQATYMDAYPDYKFSCSQAYQYDVIKRRNPDLYERIKKKIKTGQWVPVGGTWIEPDCNIPSGEAMCRQFVFGQRYFEKEFGLRCLEFWNPDVFGYNGQLPQICNLAGIKRFLTQKLSWNHFNKPHHHTFIWEGIDGSEVFTHFPPADTYNADCSIPQLRDNARNYKDHDRSHHSFYLFGYGDGGGGPTKKMIETLKRAKDLEGLPRVTMRSSNEFFDLLEKDCTDRVRVIGELYFEYHRGTYTTQAATKRGNRKSEFMLHDVEFLSTIASKHGNFDYPSGEIDELWRITLLNQFHDILPGSSIALVYDDAKMHHDQIASEGAALRASAIEAITGAGKAITPINTIGFDRAEVVTLPDESLAYVEAPSYGIGKVSSASDKVKVSRAGKNYVLENAQLRAELAIDGTLVSLIEKSTGRETMASPGNLLKLHEDRPTAWDAWDVEPQHLEKFAVIKAGAAKITEDSPLRAAVMFNTKISEHSMLSQTVRLSAHSRRLEFITDVDWHESKKILKVEFPVNVRATNATYEMQFGNVERPTHFNTMYDLARFEVPGHKWADLSEHGFGVALLTESKYGYSTFGNTMRISLLRSAKYPDPNADMGKQHFEYAILPHAGSWREAGVVAESYRYNAPILFATGKSKARSFASSSDPNLVLDTIKKSDESSGTIVRLYECHGARGTATITVDLPFKSATIVNLLEEKQGMAKVSGNQVEVAYGPYKIITLLLK
jgi:alpha-mannosidase